MPTNDAELRIGANIDDLKAATDKAVGEVRKMSDQMQSSLGSLNSAFQKIHGTFLAFTAVLAGGAAFRTVINASNDWAIESGKLAKALGTTTEQASIMKVAMNHVGVESDTVISASQKLSRQVFTNGAAFEKMGIQVKDSSGNYRPMVDIMGEANTKLVEIKNPIAQNIAGMQLYGRAWAEVKPVLKLTAEQMEWAKQRAKELHLIVGPEGEAAAKAYQQQMRDLNLVGKSLEIQFGQMLTPVFVKLGSWMGQEAPAMGAIFRNVLLTVVAAGQSVYVVFQQVGEGLGALAAMAVAALHGEFGKVGAMYDDYAAHSQKAANDLKKIWREAYDLPPMPASKFPEGKDPDYDFSKGGGSGRADRSRMAVWETELAEAKVAFQKENDLREYSKQQELDYWQSILRNVRVSGDERIAITRKSSELELEILKKARQQKIALEAEAINARERAFEDALQFEGQQAQQEFALGQLTKEQLLSLERQFEDRRFAIQQDAQAARISALLGDPNHDPVALQKLLDQMEEIYRQHAKRVAKIEGDVALNTKEEWDQLLSPISSAFEKSITGMIQGTQTLKKALSNIFQSILGEFVSLCVKMAARWAAMELAKTVETQKGSVLRTILEKMGLLQTAAAQVSTSATVATAKTAEAAAVVPAEAAEAAGGAASAVADIPVVGPALAAAAFAAVMAMVMGGLRSASGGYDIPAGVNPLTQLHAQEMVLPAEQANVIRGLASSGGSTGGDVHVHISALDARSVRDYFRANSDKLAPALRQMARNFTPARG